MEAFIRPLETHNEYRACVALQRDTWGEDFSEIVPPSILMVCQEIGGLTAGAFDENNRLIGFVFGMAGIRDGSPIHWSDLLSVDEEWRGRGVGRKLKWFQRSTMLERGVGLVFWTYEPLEARNAHFNINCLGALPERYVTGMYLSENRSVIHEGLGMDRFVVRWELHNPRVAKLAEGTPVEELSDDPPAVILRHEKSTGHPFFHAIEGANQISVDIPKNIQALKNERPDLVAGWREATREAFQHYLEGGFRVTGFRVTRDRAFYTLSKNAQDDQA